MITLMSGTVLKPGNVSAKESDAAAAPRGQLFDPVQAMKYGYAAFTFEQFATDNDWSIPNQVVAGDYQDWGTNTVGHCGSAWRMYPSNIYFHDLGPGSNYTSEYNDRQINYQGTGQWEFQDGKPIPIELDGNQWNPSVQTVERLAKACNASQNSPIKITGYDIPRTANWLVSSQYKSEVPGPGGGCGFVWPAGSALSQNSSTKSFDGDVDAWLFPENVQVYFRYPADFGKKLTFKSLNSDGISLKNHTRLDQANSSSGVGKTTVLQGQVGIGPDVEKNFTEEHSFSSSIDSGIVDTTGSEGSNETSASVSVSGGIEGIVDIGTEVSTAFNNAWSSSKEISFSKNATNNVLHSSEDTVSLALKDIPSYGTDTDGRSQYRISVKTNQGDRGTPKLFRQGDEVRVIISTKQVVIRSVAEGQFRIGGDIEGVDLMYQQALMSFDAWKKYYKNSYYEDTKIPRPRCDSNIGNGDEGERGGCEWKWPSDTDSHLKANRSIDDLMAKVKSTKGAEALGFDDSRLEKDEHGDYIYTGKIVVDTSIATDYDVKFTLPYDQSSSARSSRKSNVDVHRFRDQSEGYSEVHGIYYKESTQKGRLTKLIGSGEPDHVEIKGPGRILFKSFQDSNLVSGKGKDVFRLGSEDSGNQISSGGLRDKVIAKSGQIADLGDGDDTYFVRDGKDHFISVGSGHDVIRIDPRKEIGFTVHDFNLFEDHVDLVPGADLDQLAFVLELRHPDSDETLSEAVIDVRYDGQSVGELHFDYSESSTLDQLRSHSNAHELAVLNSGNINDLSESLAFFDEYSKPFDVVDHLIQNGLMHDRLIDHDSWAEFGKKKKVAVIHDLLNHTNVDHDQHDLFDGVDLQDSVSKQEILSALTDLSRHEAAEFDLVMLGQMMDSLT